MDSESGLKIDLKTLTDLGSFSGAPIKKRVKWSQPDRTGSGDAVVYEADVYVRPLSYATAVSEMTAFTKNQDPIAARIAASIVDENGKPVFTPGDITGDADPARGPLDGNLTSALLQIISEVNSLGKQSTSPPPTNSGTS